MMGEAQALQQMSMLYGAHMPMRFVMERSILSQTRRLGGYGSSVHGLNVHMERCEDLDFTDILNNPFESPVLQEDLQHHSLEKVFGIKA